MTAPPVLSSAETEVDPPSRGRAAAAVLGVVLLAALLLLLARPSASAVRDVDEPGYMAGGLQLAEGYSPAYRAAPAGPLTWAGWAWANARAAARIAGLGDATSKAELAAAPGALKPYVALNAVLFDAYRDQRPLRAFLLGCGFVLWLAAAAAAAGLGWRHARLGGAILVGGTWASLPIFLDLATQTRPYAWAWAFAAVAAWLADRSRSRGGDVLAAVAYGLAVASRVDMLALLPLMLCFLHRPGEGRRTLAARSLGLVLRGAAVTLVAAPWLGTSLLSNVKSILAVYVVRVAGETPGLAQSFVQIVWWQGLGPVLLLAAVGLIVAASRREAGRGRAVVLALYALFAFVCALRQTGYGLHHNGWSLVALVLCAAPAAGALAERWGRRDWRPAAVAALLIALPLAQALRAMASIRPPARHDAEVVAWLDANVPPGARLYQPYLVVNPLPTGESARAGWLWYNDVGWRRKLAWGVGRLGGEAADLADLPPAVADDTAIKERLVYRELLILGSRPTVAGPRFDVRPTPFMTVLGEPGAAPRPDDGTDRPAEAAPPAGSILVHVGVPLAAYGSPLASWTDAAGNGTFVYRADAANP